MTQDIQQATLAGHVCEPTTPPEYRDHVLPSGHLPAATDTHRCHQCHLTVKSTSPQTKPVMHRKKSSSSSSQLPCSSTSSQGSIAYVNGLSHDLETNNVQEQALFLHHSLKSRTQGAPDSTIQLPYNLRLELFSLKSAERPPFPRNGDPPTEHSYWTAQASKLEDLAFRSAKEGIEMSHLCHNGPWCHDISHVIPGSGHQQSAIGRTDEYPLSIIEGPLCFITFDH